MTSQVPICCDGIDIKHLEYDEGKTRGRKKNMELQNRGGSCQESFIIKKHRPVSKSMLKRDRLDVPIIDFRHYFL